MKRRNFLGFAGLAAALVAAVPFKRAAKPAERILIKPSAEGRVLPPVEPDRRTRGGTLCPGNAQKIAAKIEEIFKGKTLAVAKDQGCYGLELELDVEMVADWVDKSEALVKASTEDGCTSICFSAGAYFYIFTSRAKNRWMRNEFKDAYFSFDRNKLTVKERVPSGHVCTYMFQVHCEA